MTAIFAKLNFKQADAVYVIDAPESFEPELAELSGETRIEHSLDGVTGATFALAFATKQHEVDAFADAVAQATEGDVLVWIAYPKGTSKTYTCEFNRDTGWASMGAHGFEPVRQVAIDADWSALRFRRVEYIASMKRRFAMTEEGRAKAASSAEQPAR